MGTAGTPYRYDVMMRVEQLAVYGQSTRTKVSGKTVTVGPVTLQRDERGSFTVTAEKKAALPALDCYDSEGRRVAVLRLDLQPGDGRFDLARSRAILQRRVQDWKANEQKAASDLDNTKNQWEKEKLKRGGRIDVDSDMAWISKVQGQERIRHRQQAGGLTTQEWERYLAELQVKFPAATVVKDGELLALGSQKGVRRPASAIFAGHWLFDYGVLTLYQNDKGLVIGTFSSKAFRNSLAELPIAGERGTVVTAILAGQARGNSLSFTLFDARHRQRTGKLELSDDHLGGKWQLDAYPAAQ